MLDEQQAVRRRMVIFIDGEIIRDRVGLSDAANEDSCIYVFQSLSGD